MTHSNISIFVPHIGCPCRCSFCNQNSITGVKTKVSEEDIMSAVALAKKSRGYDPTETEIAFFGGSFTAIERGYMENLLKTANKFLKNNSVFGIRISTRPDAIDKEVLEILKKYGVTSIELGAQSMCDDVLVKNSRGHLSADVEKSSELIKSYGFSLGLQMMTGLYGSTPEKDRYTAERLIELKPSTVRIYPTIILKNTVLAEKFLSGEYKTYSVEETVDLCAELVQLFRQNGIEVIRTGLHSITDKDYVGGPWHPAFGELVAGRIYLNNALKQLKKTGDYTLFVNPKNISMMVGQKRENIKKLGEMGFRCRVVGNGDLPLYEVKAMEMNTENETEIN